MSQGSGGVSAPSFSQVEGSLRNVALQFGSILSLQQQLAASLGTWRELERELALARAAAGGTASEFREMEKAARDLSLASTYSAGQIANSFYNLASAGLTVTETLQAATGVILLAQATLTDLGEASDVAASAMSQFNLSALESYRVSNLLVASTNDSLSTVPKLSYALRQVGPIAYQSGLSIEQTVGALDQLFDAGLRGEQAGTALRNTIARLIDPVGDGAKALEALGITTVTATGQSRDLIEVLEELSTKNLTAGEASQIVGIEAASGFLSLMKSLRGVNSEYDEHLEKITNTDWAYQQAVVQLNTLDGALQLAGNSFNDMRIQLGQELAPLVIEFSQMLQDTAALLQDTSQETKLNAASNLLWATNLGVLFFALSRAEGAASNLAQAGANIRDGWSGASLAVSRGAGTIGDRAGAAGSAVMGLGKGLAGLASTALGIGAVAAAIWGIAEAAEAAEEAANKARTATVKSGLLDVAGEGLADSIARVNATRLAAGQSEVGNFTREDLNEPVDAGSYRRRVNQIDNRSADAFSTYRQLASAYETGNKLFDQLEVTHEALIENAQAARSNWNEVGSVMSDMYSSNRLSFDSTVTAGYVTGENFETQLVAYIERYSGADAARSAAQALALEARALEGTTGAEVQDAVGSYGMAARALIQTVEGLTDKQREELARDVDQFEQRLSTMEPTGAAKAVNIYAERMGELFQTLQENPEGASPTPFDSSTITEAMRQNANEFSTAVRQNLVLGESAFRDELDKIWSDMQSIRETQAQAQQRIPGALERLSEDLLDFVMQDTEQTGDALAQLKQLVASDEMEAIARDVAQEIGARGGDLREMITAIGERAREEKLKGAELLSKEAHKTLALFLFNDNEMSLKIDQANLQLNEALLKLAEMSGDPSAAQQAEALARQGGALGQREVIQSFITDAANNTSDAGKQIIGLLQAIPSRNKEFVDNVNAYVQGEVEMTEAVNNALDILDTEGLGVREAQSFRSRLMLMFTQADVVDKETQAELAKVGDDGKRDRERFFDQVNKLIEDLLSLPSAEELAINAERIALEARYKLDDYFGFQLRAIDKQVETVALDLRARRISLQDKFRKIFTDTLAKDTDNATGADLSLQEAFSGAVLSDIMDSGSANVFGTEITREAIQTAEGMQTFVDTVITRFAQAVDGQPAAQQRIDAARRMVTGMVNEFIAIQQEIAAELERLRLEREKAEAAINRTLTDFQYGKFLRDIERAMELPTDSAGRLTFDLELALQAEVTQVQVNAEQAKRDVIEEYAKVFQALEIPVSVAPDGTLRRYDPQDPTVESIQDFLKRQSADDRPKGTAADPIYVSMGGMGGPAAGGDAQFIKPLPDGSYRITSNFGTRKDPFTGETRSHTGMDLAAASGTPVSAMHGGRVVYAGRKGGYGNNVELLDPSSGIRTSYSHLKEIGVQVGQTIAQGIQLGTVGSTGRSTGSHLHLEAFQGRNRIDPSPFLNGAGGNYSQFNNSRGDVVQAPFQPQDPGEVKIRDTRIEITEEMEKQAEALLRAMNQELAAVDSVRDARIRFLTDSENAELVIIENVLDARMAAWEQYEGRLLQTMERIKQVEADVSRTQEGVARAALGDPNGNFSENLANFRDAYIQARQDENNLAAQQEIGTTKELYAQYQVVLQSKMDNAETDEERAYLQSRMIDLGAEEEAAIRNITDAVDRENEALTRNIDVRREVALTAAAGLAEQAANNPNDPQNMVLGARAAALQFAAEVPTVFETMEQVALTAMNGVSDAMTTLFTQGTQGVKQAVASMLMSMAQLITRMLAMYAVMQLIRALPGGTALLAALDASSAAVTAVSSGVSAAGAVVQADANATGGVGGGAAQIRNGNSVAIAPIFTPQQRAQGGIRAPYDPAISVFGEGDYPEAYIPMVDRRTVPVMFDNNGNPFVPLPSGQRIPVSMRTKKYAKGGISDNVITSMPRLNAVAQARDYVQGSTGRSSGSMGTTIQSHNENHISVPITLNGGATKQDADLVSQAVLEQIMNYLDARERENVRQTLRNRGDLLDQNGIRP